MLYMNMFLFFHFLLQFFVFYFWPNFSVNGLRRILF